MGLLEKLKQKRPPRVTVHVPQWGEDIAIKRWGADEKLSFLAYNDKIERGDDGKPKDPVDAWNLLVEVISRAVVDESGALVFESPAAREFLLSEDIKTLRFIADQVVALNGLDNSVEDEIEEAKKN